MSAAAEQTWNKMRKVLGKLSKFNTSLMAPFFSTLLNWLMPKIAYM